MHYEITRALKHGKQLTTAQRSSSLFAEEPVVLGKVLRRGSRPIILTEEIFKKNEVKLRNLERAGSIQIRSRADQDQTVEPKVEPVPEIKVEAQVEVIPQEPVEVVAEEDIPPITEEATVSLVDIAPQNAQKKGKKRKE